MGNCLDITDSNRNIFVAADSGHISNSPTAVGELVKGAVDINPTAVGEFKIVEE